MKKIFYLLAAAFAAVGCNEKTLDDLGGKYPSPTEYKMTTLENMSIVKLDKPLRQVTVKLTGDGSTLSVDFVTNDWFLKAGAYAKGGDTPVNGTWIPASTTFNSKPVLAGTINVALAEGSVYTIGGVLQLSATETVNVAYTGEIVFPEDPPVVTYTVENAGAYWYTLDGQNYSQVEGSQVSKITVYADDVLRAYFEIVGSASASSLAGSYPVSGSITDASGAVVRGSYVDLPALGWGTDIIKSGSYLMEGANQQFLFDGTLTIATAGEGLSFTSSDFTILDITSSFMAPTALPGTVAISYLNGTKVVPPVTLTKFLGLSNNSGYGTPSITVKLGTDGITATPNAWGGMDMGGDGSYISIDFYSADGNLAAGTYGPQAGATIAAGEWQPGYDFPDYGMYNLGTCWFTVAGGVPTATKLSTGSITVAEAGGVYTINGTFGNIKITYTGALTE